MSPHLIRYEFRVLHGSDPSEAALNALGQEGFYIVTASPVPKATSYGGEGFVILLQRPIPEDRRPH